MNKSCNGCRAFCVSSGSGFHRQGCGLGLPTKKIWPVISKLPLLCYTVFIAPETNCRKIKTIQEAIDCGSSEFKVTKWIS